MINNSVVMKKLSVILLVLLIISIKPLYPQRELLIDTDDDIHLQNVRIDNNGDYVAVFSRDSADYNFTGGIVKFNEALQYQMYSQPYDTSYYMFKDVVVTDDNNYLIAGTVGENIGLWVQNYTIYLLLLDENLNFITENFYELPEQYTNPYLKMLKNTDGRIYVTIDEPSNFLKGTLEVSSDAEILKDKMYFSMGSGIINPFPKPDGGFYIFRDNPGWAMGGITEVDTNLNFDTTYLFPEIINGVIYDMGTRGSCKWLNDTTYLLCSEGTLESTTKDIYIYKINNWHEFMSEPFIIGNEYEDDILPNYQSIDWVDPQNIYVTGFMLPSMYAQSTYYVAVINENFEVLGYKICGGDYNTYIQSILSTDNGGCIMVGWQRDYHAGNPLDGDGYIAYFQPEDIITSANETANPWDSDYLLYPNPGNEQLYIQTARKGVVLKMYDQLGHLVLHQMLNDEFRNQIETRTLKAGFYTCQLTDKDGNTEHINWIKQ